MVRNYLLSLFFLIHILYVSLRPAQNSRAFSLFKYYHKTTEKACDGNKVFAPKLKMAQYFVKGQTKDITLKS